jgi:adenylosuccinate synthase
MLDVDHGTYPFVTSSNPSIGGIVTGLGMAPTKFEAIIGVVSSVMLLLLGVIVLRL